MNIGIVITTYNRPALLKKTLQDFDKTELPDNIEQGCVIIIDDASQDLETIKIINEYKLTFPANWSLIKIFHSTNGGMYTSLNEGFDLLTSKGFETLCNLDGDILLKTYWLKAIVRLYDKFKHENIITGFNFNPQLVIEKYNHTDDGYMLKMATGGINYIFSKENYYKYVRPAFEYKNFWDSHVSDNHFKDKKMFVCASPSVIQHHIDINDKTKNPDIIATDYSNVDGIWDSKAISLYPSI
jgi:glycosyltransferase involved in cell wall biosynthesis